MSRHPKLLAPKLVSTDSSVQCDPIENSNSSKSCHIATSLLTTSILSYFVIPRQSQDKLPLVVKNFAILEYIH